MLFEERPQEIEKFEKPGFGYIGQPISPTSPGQVHYAGTSWSAQFIAVDTWVRTSRNLRNVRTFKRSWGKCLNRTGYSYNCSVGTGKMMPNERVIVVGRVGITLLIAPEYIYEK